MNVWTVDYKWQQKVNPLQVDQELWWKLQIYCVIQLKLTNLKHSVYIFFLKSTELYPFQRIFTCYPLS